jgi:hypothetical protein
MTFILFQRGATSLGFQISRFEMAILYPRFWKTSSVFRFKAWPKGSDHY